MHNKADHLALRAILFLLGVIALVLSLSRVAPALAEKMQSTPVPKAVEPVVPKVTVHVSTPPPTPARRLNKSGLLALASEDAEPEVRRAIPVTVPIPAAVPTPQPSEVTVEVGPKRWSKLVEVPPGKIASITFSLGRIKIERNGVNLGTFFRNAMLQGEQLGPSSYNVRVRPWAMLDRSPRILDFDRETRTLRFLSLESSSENVLVEFRE